MYTAPTKTLGDGGCLFPWKHATDGTEPGHGLRSRLERRGRSKTDKVGLELMQYLARVKEHLVQMSAKGPCN
jgi:hypothetical protein